MAWPYWAAVVIWAPTGGPSALQVRASWSRSLAEEGGATEEGWPASAPTCLGATTARASLRLFTVRTKLLAWERTRFPIAVAIVAGNDGDGVVAAVVGARGEADDAGNLAGIAGRILGVRGKSGQAGEGDLDRVAVDVAGADRDFDDAALVDEGIGDVANFRGAVGVGDFDGQHQVAATAGVPMPSPSSVAVTVTRCPAARLEVAGSPLVSRVSGSKVAPSGRPLAV
ncbi:MAG: hypothetical protein U1E96_02580 [Azonexus sp.]